MNIMPPSLMGVETYDCVIIDVDGCIFENIYVTGESGVPKGVILRSDNNTIKNCRNI